MEPSTASQISSKLMKTIIKNTGYVMFGNTVLKIINFVFSIFVIRRLGDDRFGQYSIVIAFVSVLQIIAEPGISQFIMREIAQDRRKTHLLFWNLIAIRMVLGTISVTLITSAAIIFGYTQEIIIGVFVFSLSFLLAAWQSPLQIVLTANERFDYVTIMNIVGQIVFVIFGSGFLFGGLSFVWLIVAGMVNIAVQIIIGFKAAYSLNLIEYPVLISINTWPRLISKGLPFGLITLSLTIAFSIDTIILSKYVTNNEVGWYNVAYNLIFSIMFISSSFKDAMTPSLSKAYINSPDEINRWYYRILKAIVLISLPIAAGGMLLSEKTIQFLYTEDYHPASLALQIIIWDIPFLMFNSFGGNICTVINKEKIGAKIYSITALSNILMNLFLIPRFGYLGASVATVLTDLIASVQFFILFKRELKPQSINSIILRIFAAVIGMGVGVYFSRGFNLFISIGLGVILYGLLVMLLHIMDQTELSFFLRIFKKFVSFFKFRKA